MRTMIGASALVALLAAPAAADTRALSGFDAINASGNYRVDVSVGEAYSIVVTGADAARIRTRLDGDTLKIEPMRRSWFGNPRYDATVRVTLPRLEGVAASRGMSMTATAGGECGMFDAAAAMGAELVVTGLQCGTISAAAAMGAELSLNGSCTSLEVSAAMGANVRADGLLCERAEISAAMGADVDAYASAAYDASAAMGADVSVAGGARQGERSAAMGGSVRQTN